MTKNKKSEPPKNQPKSDAQKWKEFGDFLNANDIKDSSARSKTAKSRSLKLGGDITKYFGGGKNIPGGDVQPTTTPKTTTPKKYPSVSSRPIRDAKPRPKRPSSTTERSTPTLGVAQGRPKSSSSRSGFPKSSSSRGGLSLGLMGVDPSKSNGNGSSIFDSIKRRSSSTRSDNTRTDIFGHNKRKPTNRPAPRATDKFFD